MELLDTKTRYKRQQAEMEEAFKRFREENGLDTENTVDEEDDCDLAREREEEAQRKWDETVLDEFNSTHMCSKEDVIRQIDRILKELKNELLKATTTNDYAFQKTLISLVMKFRTGVNELILLKKMDDFWGYGIEIDDDGVRLQLLTYSHPDIHKNMEFKILQEFVLYEVQPQMLTVEEYAERYDVKTVTVRQWIRRGKIRTAKKIGKEWRISELLEIKNRGYQSGFYKWEVTLDGLPKEWKFINECNAVQISQEKSGTFIASFRKKGSDELIPYKEYRIDEGERAKLEMLLISNPFVKGTDNASMYEAYV